MKEIKLKIPNSLSEIKLIQYVKIMDIVDTNRDEIDDFLHLIVSIACDIPSSHTRHIPYGDLVETTNVILTALEDKAKLIRTFKMNNVEYGFIPDLSNLSFGEFVDLQKYLEDVDKNLNKIMSVLYRPVTVKKGNLYDIEDYTGKENYLTMDEMPMDIAKGAVFFLGSLLIKLSRITQEFSK